MASLVTLHKKDDKGCCRDVYIVCSGPAGVVFCRVSREKCECAESKREC